MIAVQMKILVTGANGFLGKSIVKELSKENTLFSLSRSSEDYKVSLDNEIPVFIQKFDLVIHAAGKAHFVPNSRAENKQFFDVNVLGTRNLLQGLENTSLPEQFVFISSVAVYGKESGNLISETEKVLAKDPYGQSKILAEELVTTWCVKNKVICTILRLPLIAGRTPPGNLVSMIRGIEKGYYFNIAAGKSKKSMVLAQDIAAIIPKAAEIGGVYNLTDGYHPSFAELAELISKQLGKTKPGNIPFWLARTIAKFGDLFGTKAPLNSDKLKKITSDLTFDDSRARANLNWNPTPVLAAFKIN